MIEIRVATVDLGRAITALGPLVTGMNTDPPAAGPEAQLTVATDEDHARMLLGAHGIGVLASRPVPMKLPPLLHVIFDALHERGWEIVDNVTFVAPDGERYGTLDSAIAAQSFREIAGS